MPTDSVALPMRLRLPPSVLPACLLLAAAAAPARAQTPAGAAPQSLIVRAESGRPLVGARVSDRTTSYVTDEAGRVRLASFCAAGSPAAADGAGLFTVRQVGFRPDSLRVPCGTREAAVVLRPIAGLNVVQVVAVRERPLLNTADATTGGSPETDINRIFWNQLSIIGSTMATPGEVDDVLSLVWDGTFDVRIRETLPMSETATAHERIENREGFGKVVVIPDSEY